MRRVRTIGLGMGLRLCILGKVDTIVNESSFVLKTDILKLQLRKLT